MGRLSLPAAGVVRRADWERRLGVWYAEASRTAFAWGAHDCSLGAFSGIEAETGVDLVPEFRPTALGPRYRSERGAIGILGRFLRKSAAAVPDHAGDRLEAAVEIVLARAGIEAIPPRRAQRGDFVFIRGLGRAPWHCLVGLVWSNGVPIFTPDGFRDVPAALATRAWRI